MTVPGFRDLSLTFLSSQSVRRAMEQISLEYEGGVAVFRPTYEQFKDFRQFVNKIEPIGMKTGIVKVIPPDEWKSKLPKLPTALIDKIEIRNPITQSININGGRGIYSIDNIERRRKFTIKQWLKQCNTLSNQPPTKRGEAQRVLGKYTAKPGDFVHYGDADFTPEVLGDLEAKYWKGLAYGGAPMYGADLPGSLFDEKTKDWNVANLDSMLQLLPEPIPGVSDAYLYCGMWKATFAWHLEDVDLPSINYIHFGAPKQWYSIPQEYHQQFYDFMAAVWPDEFEKCPEFLRHKTFLVDPSMLAKQGIPVNRVVHRQQEFMITFPYGYHAGFNYGFNVAESVNFAHDSWINIGLSSKSCRCVNHSVAIDVERMVDLIQNPDELEAERQRVQAKARSGDPEPSVVKARRLGKCVLCPHIYDGRYVNNKEHSAYAHVVCANLIPEAWIVGNTVFGMEDIDRERFGLKCLHCKQTVGPCFQCSYPSCTRSYHGSCAAAAGVDYHDSSAPMCRFHRVSKYAKLGDERSEALLPGDVVQGMHGKSYFAGIVRENRLSMHEVYLGVLPDPVEDRAYPYDEIVTVFKEARAGPYVESLTSPSPIVKSKPKRKAPSRSEKTEEQASSLTKDHTEALEEAVAEPSVEIPPSKLPKLERVESKLLSPPIQRNELKP